MEKQKYELCLKILKKFSEAGFLDDIVLGGSWATYFFQYYFEKKFTPGIRTTDIDFVIPIPFKTRHKSEVFELVKEMGFIKKYCGSQGYIKYEHPGLTLEFIAPEYGKGTDKPYDIKDLGVKASAIRYLDIVTKNTIIVTAERLKIRIPHPAAYLFNKLIIFKRRKNKEKAAKDLQSAVKVYEALIENNKAGEMRVMFNKLHSSWQKTIVKNLISVKLQDIVDELGKS